MSCSYNQDDQNFRRLLSLEAKITAIREVVGNATWFEYDKYDGSMYQTSLTYDAFYVDADDMRKIADILDP